MNLDNIFHLPKGSPSTFAKDEDLPPLPLPKLEDSLEKYYKSLTPFGNKEELENSQNIINDFKNGIGKELHKLLEEKAKVEKNWVDKWWSKYAYMMTRTPLIPFGSMCQPLILATVGIEESENYYFKSLARMIHYSVKLWDLIRKERLKPAELNGTVFSSYLWKQFFNTVRVPGEFFDEVVCHFKTEREGVCPSHFIIIGDGRIFMVQSLNPDGSIRSPQQFYQCVQQIQAEIDAGNKRNVPPIPLLTCDDRTTWSKNRLHLMEVSKNNKNILELVETASLMICLDDNKPNDYTESSLYTVAGNFHSKWVDKSSVSVVFRNGKFGCIGEHSCYDGTICVSYDLYIQMSFLENPEPDWDETLPNVTQAKELFFDADEYILCEIDKMKKVADERQHAVVVRWDEFQHFGKGLLKIKKIHPDAFVQMALQLTYYKLHKGFAPTYETAMMRFYYKGRTETVRSCSQEAVNWVLAMQDEKTTNQRKLELFQTAIIKHNTLMKEAREGKGFDRHLFALWCLTFENGYDTHRLFTDPLFIKSGGSGNFILSTSLLGYSGNNGFVSPMCVDGYGVFYSITENEIYNLVATSRESTSTSTHKFVQTFFNTMLEMKDLIENINKGKL